MAVCPTITSPKPCANMFIDMPAKAVLFDQRVRTLHDFGSAPQNYISFNPQGRLIALAGFGNLAGKINIFDRRTLTKVTTIDAPNTSVCQWSPDGRFLLTATLSPRLRVDNGVMLWHCTGPLMHVQRTDELYQASWRPARIEDVPPFPAQIPPAPAASASVSQVAAAKPVNKPAGAYRPPGARGLAAPSIFKREDEGGSSFNLAGSGASTPARYGRGSPAPGAATSPNGSGRPNGNGPGGRYVPGAAPPEQRQQQEGGGGKKKKKPRKSLPAAFPSLSMGMGKAKPKLTLPGVRKGANAGARVGESDLDSDSESPGKRAAGRYGGLGLGRPQRPGAAWLLRRSSSGAISTASGESSWPATPTAATAGGKSGTSYHLTSFISFGVPCARCRYNDLRADPKRRVVRQNADVGSLFVRRMAASPAPHSACCEPGC